MLIVCVSWSTNIVGGDGSFIVGGNVNGALVLGKRAANADTPLPLDGGICCTGAAAGMKAGVCGTWRLAALTCA